MISSPGYPELQTGLWILPVMAVTRRSKTRLWFLDSLTPRTIAVYGRVWAAVLIPMDGDLFEFFRLSEHSRWAPYELQSPQRRETWPPPRGEYSEARMGISPQGCPSTKNPLLSPFAISILVSSPPPIESDSRSALSVGTNLGALARPRKV